MLKHPLLPLMPNRGDRFLIEFSRIQQKPVSAIIGYEWTNLVVVAVARYAFGRPCHAVATAESRHATGAQHLRLFYRHHLQGGADICLFHIVCSF